MSRWDIAIATSFNVLQSLRYRPKIIYIKIWLTRFICLMVCYFTFRSQLDPLHFTENKELRMEISVLIALPITSDLFSAILCSMLWPLELIPTDYTTCLCYKLASSGVLPIIGISTLRLKRKQVEKFPFCSLSAFTRNGNQRYYFCFHSLILTVHYSTWSHSTM